MDRLSPKPALSTSSLTPSQVTGSSARAKCAAPLLSIGPVPRSLVGRPWPHFGPSLAIAPQRNHHGTAPLPDLVRFGYDSNSLDSSPCHSGLQTGRLRYRIVASWDLGRFEITVVFFRTLMTYGNILSPAPDSPGPTPRGSAFGFPVSLSSLHCEADVDDSPWQGFVLSDEHVHNRCGISLTLPGV